MSKKFRVVFIILWVFLIGLDVYSRQYLRAVGGFSFMLALALNPKHVKTILIIEVLGALFMAISVVNTELWIMAVVWGVLALIPAVQLFRK